MEKKRRAPPSRTGSGIVSQATSATNSNNNDNSLLYDKNVEERIINELNNENEEEEITGEFTPISHPKNIKFTNFQFDIEDDFDFDDEEDEDDEKNEYNQIKAKYEHWIAKGYKKMNFSIDLAKTTLITFEVLDYLHDNSHFREKSFGEYSLLRYRQFLLFKSTLDNAKSNSFIPPPDVQVVWAAHLIRQLKYRSDLKRQFGKWFHHLPISRSCHSEEINSSKQLWEEYHREPYDPDYDHHLEFNRLHNHLTLIFPLSIGVDALEEDYKWISDCKEYYPEYHNVSFVEDCLLKYKQFLLNSCEEKVQNIFVESIGPPIDTDSVWHAHQQSTSSYEKDLQNLIGFTFYHVPNAET